MTKPDAIADIIRDVSPSIQIRADQYDESLFELGLDSLDHASVLLAVEEKCDVKIPDEVAESLTSVSAISEFVASQQSGR